MDKGSSDEYCCIVENYNAIVSQLESRYNIHEEAIFIPPLDDFKKILITCQEGEVPILSEGGFILIIGDITTGDRLNLVWKDTTAAMVISSEGVENVEKDSYLMNWVGSSPRDKLVEIKDYMKSVFSGGYYLYIEYPRDGKGFHEGLFVELIK